MAKVTAPLLSFGASGSVAQTQVYAKWRGIPYVRRYTVPENPRTVGQQSTRNAFRCANALWLTAPTLVRAPWDRYAAGRPFTGRNAFVGKFVDLLRGEDDMTGILLSPGSGGGLPPDTVVATPTDGVLTVAVTVPTGPTGWTLDGAVVAIVEDQDPEADFAGQLQAAEDLVAPYEAVFSALANGTQYVVAGWLRWITEGGRTAYSPSVSTTGTPAV